MTTWRCGPGRRSVWRAVDAAGVERTRIERGRRRRPATVFGKVTVTRIACLGTGVEDLHPADAALNPPSGMHAHGLARPAAIEATRGTFAEARERVDAVTGAGVGHRQIQELVLAAAAGIDAFYDALAPAPCTDTTPLILSADGLGVVMRAGKGSADAGLASAPGNRTDAADSPARVRNSPAHPTESAAAGPGSALSTRHASATKNGRKWTATVGSVHDADPCAHRGRGHRRPRPLRSGRRRAARSAAARPAPGPDTAVR
jgi:hypothetical protein